MRLLAALPLAMVAQAALELVDAAAVLAGKVLGIGAAGARGVLVAAEAARAGRAPDDRRDVPRVPGGSRATQIGEAQVLRCNRQADVVLFISTDSCNFSPTGEGGCGRSLVFCLGARIYLL